MLRQVLAGFAAFVCMVALTFALLRWRMKTPEQHLNFDQVIAVRVDGQSHD
jgi:hypothetical protein